MAGSDFISYFIHKPLYSINYKLINSQWTIRDRTTFVYSDIASALPDADVVSEIKVFPNPSAGTIRIEFSDPEEIGNISLYDLTGRKLFERELRGNTNLSLEQLNENILIYKVRTVNKSIAGKLLVTK